MATAHYVLKTIAGVSRPAIISTWPTINPEKEVYILDLGANVDSEAIHLFQFAVMGSVLVEAVENIARPKVGLLNIGAEEIKGNEQVKQAASLLANNQAINYIGYIEGDDIFKGDVDIVVCDGFIGNVTLKAIEGLAKLISAYAKRGFSRNLYTKTAALISLPVLKDLARELDPGRRNGASLIGLQGIVIKSHGGANEAAFSNAIEEAVLEVEKNVSQRIRDEVSKLLQQKS
jgi:glycerol-3-phosphate acyltransferase PlsX